MAEGGFENGGVTGACEGGPQVIVHREAAAHQDRDDRFSQTLDLSFSTNLFQTGVALAMEEIAEDYPARRLAVIQSLHRHRIGEDSRRFELLAGIRDAQLLAWLMHLHP